MAAWSAHDAASAVERLGPTLALAGPEHLSEAVAAWVQACLRVGVDPLVRFGVDRFYSERVLLFAALLQVRALERGPASALAAELMEALEDEADPDRALLAGLPLLLGAASLEAWDLVSTYAVRWRVPPPVLAHAVLLAEAKETAIFLSRSGLLDELWAIPREDWDPTYPCDDAWCPADLTRGKQACADVVGLAAAGSTNFAALRRLWAGS